MLMVDSIFPGPESPAVPESGRQDVLAVAELTALFDRHGIGTRPMGPNPPVVGLRKCHFSLFCDSVTPMWKTVVEVT